MPLYDYKCDQCDTVTEAVRKSSVSIISCPECAKDEPEVNARLGEGLAYRQISAPACFKFPDMATLTKKRQRIKEPIWRYPDGHIESVN